MARVISVEEISKHNIPEDLWIVVDNIVYDMSEYAQEHPGGPASNFSPLRCHLVSLTSF
jgi:cytochrome b involved in lipid metabolism